MITNFTSIADAAVAVQDYLIDHGSEIPEDVRVRLRDLVGPTRSPVDTAVHSSEIIYARQSELPPELLKLGASLALVCEQYNFHGMAEDRRGSGIALALMRKAKVTPPRGVKYPEKDNDPAPKEDLLRKEEPAPAQ